MLENARRAMRDALEEPRQIQVYVFSPMFLYFYEFGLIESPTENA